MRIGISVGSAFTPGDPREGPRTVIAQVQAARDAGLDTLSIGDHHSTGPGVYLQNTPMPVSYTHLDARSKKFLKLHDQGQHQKFLVNTCPYLLTTPATIGVSYGSPNLQEACRVSSCPPTGGCAVRRQARGVE